MPQIDVDIFEPQGISKLDAQASFLSKEQAAQLIKKSFSGKKVCGMAGGWQALRDFSSWPNQAGDAGQPRGERWGNSTLLALRALGQSLCALAGEGADAGCLVWGELLPCLMAQFPLCP